MSKTSTPQKPTDKTAPKTNPLTVTVARAIREPRRLRRRMRSGRSRRMQPLSSPTRTKSLGQASRAMCGTRPPPDTTVVVSACGSTDGSQGTDTLPSRENTVRSENARELCGPRMKVQLTPAPLSWLGAGFQVLLNDVPPVVMPDQTVQYWPSMYSKPPVSGMNPSSGAAGLL
jgi:hypothetical protein